MPNPYYIPRGPRITAADRLFNGIAQGLNLRFTLEQAQQRAQQFEQEQQLRQQKLDEMLQQQKMQRTLEGYAQQYLEPTQQLNPNPGAEPGFNPDPNPEAFPHELYAQQSTPPSPERLATGLAILQRNPNALARLALPGGATSPVNSFEAAIARQLYGKNAPVEDFYGAAERLQGTKPQRTPADIVNRTYAQVLNETGDPAAAEAAAIAVRQRVSQAASTGTAQGTLGVKATPEFQRTESNVAKARAEGSTEGSPLPAGTAEKVSALMTAKQQLESIEKNFNETFLGPVRGTETAFNVRRSVGSYIGSPLGEQETIFRQSLADVKDQLLRARSGAQINETEYKRLAALLPAARDELPVFKAGLKRFKEELLGTIENKITLGTTPKSKLAIPTAGTDTRSKEQRLKDLGFE